MCLSKIYQTNAARHLPPPCGAYRRPCSQTHHTIKNLPTPTPQARLSIRPSPTSPTCNASAVPIRPSSKIRARPRHSKKLSPGLSKHYADKCGLSALAPQGLKSHHLKARIPTTAPLPQKSAPLHTKKAPHPQSPHSQRPSIPRRKKNPSGFSDLLNISLLKCQQV